MESDHLVLAYALHERHEAGQDTDIELLDKKRRVLHVRLEKQCAWMLPCEVLEMPIENMASPELFLREVNHDFRLAHT